jgi:Tol biopolymer transport system component
MAQPFDTERLALTGELVPLADAIVTFRGPPVGLFSTSSNGVLAYQTAGSTNGVLTWFDRSGKSLGVLGESKDYGSVELSPDGHRVAVSVRERGQTRDIWIRDVARGAGTRVTTDWADDAIARWNPDGSEVVFNSRRNNQFDLYQKLSTGIGAEKLVLSDASSKEPLHWSPDGRFLAYSAFIGGTGTGSDIWLLPMSPGGKSFPYLNGPFNEVNGRISPTGKWMAYASNETGTFQVYVTPFPNPTGKWPISTEGGNWPRWGADDQEIFYMSPSNQLMVASVKARGASVDVIAVQPLFRVRATAGRYTYDVTRDGKRFLINTVEDTAGPDASLTIVVNWHEELKRLQAGN